MFLFYRYFTSFVLANCMTHFALYPEDHALGLRKQFIVGLTCLSTKNHPLKGKGGDRAHRSRPVFFFYERIAIRSEMTHPLPGTFHGKRNLIRAILRMVIVSWQLPVILRRTMICHFSLPRLNVTTNGVRRYRRARAACYQRKSTNYHTAYLLSISRSLTNSRCFYAIVIRL